MSDYSVCPFCGKQAYTRGFPPHGHDPCPLKVEEHQAKIAAIERRTRPLVTFRGEPLGPVGHPGVPGVR